MFDSILMRLFQYPLNNLYSDFIQVYPDIFKHIQH